MKWLFLKNGIRLAAVGWAIGLGISFLLLNFLTKMLPNHGISGPVSLRHR